MQYIEDTQELGIAYDWKLIRKELKKLGIPTQFYNPSSAPLSAAQWFVEVSERTVGKTNGWLLLGLVMYKLYGTVTIYTRSTKEMIAPKHSSTLFSVILENGYIEKLTEGKYNSILYKSRKWFLTKIDENGDTKEVALDYCCRMVSIDEAENMKSTLNEFKGDLILWDEFIPVSGHRTRPTEFVNFCDLVSTVFRLRRSGIIALLANTIDKNNQILYDLEIQERIAIMQFGDHEIYSTNKSGTKIYIEMIGSKPIMKAKKRIWNGLFMGFNKPELSSITGESTWVVHNYQHIPDDPDNEGIEIKPLYTKIYIFHNNKYVRLDIMKHSELGTLIYAHWATKTYSDSIILTNVYLYDKRYINGIGRHTRIGTIIERAIKYNKVYYSGNDVGTFLQNYLLNIGERALSQILNN